MSRDPLADLDRALELFAQWRTGETRTTAAQFLSAHEDLRELLEPLVSEPGDASSATEPRSVGDFRLLCEIGRGGMGVVYEADQVSLDRRVALKILPPHLGLPAHTVARFRREALVTGRLRHAGLRRGR